MSAITLTGGLFSLIRPDALTGTESVLFLKHLLTHIDRRLLVIWDGSPIHRSQHVKDFLANGGTKRVHLERLPSYAPDLNPDEGTWQHLKHVELRNLCCRNLNHLHCELTLALRRLRRRPALIQSFFTGAGLAI